MTSLQKTSRANFVRQRRGSKSRTTSALQHAGQTARRAFNPASVYLPVKPKPVTSRPAGRSTRSSSKNGYDVSFTVGRTRVQAPMFNLPQLGPRTLSTSLTLFLGLLLYIMWTASPFMVNMAVVRGNQRLEAAEINSMLLMIGQPIFKVIPSQVEADLNTAFPDLASVHVQVRLPNRIIIDVVERQPVVAWYQDGLLTWIDNNGFSFTQRGEVPGLVLVSANGAPPAVPVDPALPFQERQFIAPEMVQALLTLAPDVPAGMPFIFDPVYGMGWQDPRGWTVYFGQTADDIGLKKEVYKTILDKLIQTGIQPSLISVEFLDAPFYK